MMASVGGEWEVLHSSFVTGAAGIMRAAYSPSLTVPVPCEDGASSAASAISLSGGYNPGTARLSFPPWWPK